MVLTARMFLVGIEEYISPKTQKKYLRLAFVQGADTITFLTDDMGMRNAPLFKECNCLLSYNTRYNRLELQSFKTV